MYSGTGHRRKDLLGGAPRQRSKSRDVSAVPSSCIWIFVLVVLAIPGVSYYFLHSRLVERYVALERAFHAEREQVTQLKTQVADLSKIKDSLSNAVQLLKELEKPKAGESMRPRIASSEPIYAPKYDRVVPKAIRGSAECATALEPFFGSTPDLYSSGVFKDRTHGVFVDVGAGDGVFQSKTHFYEQHLCWTGITVEPTPYEFEKLRTQRSKSTAFCQGRPAHRIADCAAARSSAPRDRGHVRPAAAIWRGHT
ncbi:hypothetical protein CYMTET_31665 [Cymbomonas tetramitiformis]|uniref:Methyltransferase FkbM domain-containing protein n=1 Tax=Cymbomonas tetramitiformis TaxID=36881 RepID=A0AAE0FGQ9_9CHLO|nr:hypothetical protein CYMTET_31665 [Cymbomonas tetramitiformis]